MNKLKDKTMLLLSSVGAAAFVFMNIIENKPNRISAGIKYSSFEFFGSIGIIILMLWGILIALSFYEHRNKNHFVFIFITFPCL